ncbi:MAG TPA: extensin family protein [Polyangiaceae bacterium]
MRSRVLAFSLLLAACDAAPPATPASTMPVPTPAPVAARSPAPVVQGGPVDPTAPAPTKRPGAFANDDPGDDLVVGPPDVLADCDDQLVKAGVDYRVATLPVHAERRSKILCGAPQVVIYAHGPGGITYSPSPLLTCSMALALASFEKVVQEEAARAFHSPVVRIDQLGTYSCREIIAYPGWVSEHSYANAIDLARFTLKNGVTVDVQRDFDLGAEQPRRPAGAFLRAVSQRAYDEDIFSHVLTPFFNAAHRNHFHVDLARYRGDGTRPET